MLTEEQITEIKKGLTTSSDFDKTFKLRNTSYVFDSVSKLLREEKEAEGWEVYKESKLKISIRQQKPNDEAFEDKVWSLMARMGYRTLNIGRKWVLPYGEAESETQQIDVFAMNEDTVLVVECKAAEEKNKKGSFKKDLEAYTTKMPGIRKTIKELFPSKDLRVKFIFATSNYALGPEDKERVTAVQSADGKPGLNGLHLTEEVVDYFLNMYNEIKDAAQYQFFGYIFEGEPIPNLSIKVPAIKAQMGGYTYYSFSIEPKKLLKISYVLHKNKANDTDNAYQRIVKKDRLIKINKFIDEAEGFFPNSIIVNINTSSPLKFEEVSISNKDCSSSVGLLHLPPMYKSAYVIDGQHRLLGYAGTSHEADHTIPVICFENLEGTKQIDLFMQINENQKAINKNLLNTLNANLLEASPIINDRLKAIRLQTAEALAKDRNSPLFDCVSSGEDNALISSTAIENGLKSDIFLGRYQKNNNPISTGLFYDTDIEKAKTRIKDYVFRCLDYLVEGVSEVEQPNDKNNVILASRGIYAYLRCLGDILDKENKESDGHLAKETPKRMYELSLPYLHPLIEYFNDLDEDTRSELKKSYGAGGEKHFLRTFEKVIHEDKPSFCPDGLTEYWARFSQDRIKEALDIIDGLEESFKNDVYTELTSKYDKSWMMKGLPKSLYAKIQSKIFDLADTQYEEKNLLELDNIKDIVIQNWDEMGERYTQEGAKGTKYEKTEWLDKLVKIRLTCKAKGTIESEDLELLHRLKQDYAE